MRMRDSRHRGRSLLPLVVAALVAVALAWAAPAQAHSDLLFSTPEDGAVLDTVPAQVDLAFSEEVVPDTVVVSVEDETGFAVRVLDIEVDGADVYVTWPPGMRGTQYAVNYRVVSQDGHPVTGTVRFSVTTAPTDGLAAAPVEQAASAAPAPASPTAAATGDSDTTTRAAVIAILVGLGVGVVIGLAFMAARRRRAATTPGPTTPPHDGPES